MYASTFQDKCFFVALLISIFFTNVYGQRPSASEMEISFDETLQWIDENVPRGETGLVLRSDTIHYQARIRDGETFKDIRFDIGENCVQAESEDSCVGVGEQIASELPHWYLTNVVEGEATVNYADARFNALIARALMRMYEETGRSSYLNQAGQIVNALLNELDRDSNQWLRLRKSDTEQVYIARINSFLLLSAHRYFRATGESSSPLLEDLAQAYEFTDEGVWNHWQSAVLGQVAKSDILGVPFDMQENIESGLQDLRSQIHTHDGKIPYVMDPNSPAYPDFRPTYQTLDARLLARIGATTDLSPNISSSELWPLIWEEATDVNYASHWANNTVTPLYMLEGSKIEYDEWMIQQAEKPIFTRDPRSTAEAVAVLRAVSASLKYWSMRGEMTFQIVDGRDGKAYLPDQLEPGTDSNPMGRLYIDADGVGGMLREITITNHMAPSDGVLGLSLWLSSDSTFSISEDRALASRSHAPSTRFRGLQVPIATNGMYLFVTADLDSSASGYYEPIIQSQQDIRVDGNTLSGVNDRDATTFSQLYLSEIGNLLPVELVAFNATHSEKSVSLQWDTASETNNAGFEVQRANSDPNEADEDTLWTTLAFVEGAGTTDEPQSYRFTVDDVSVGTHAFRLRQVDTYGTESFSEPVEVDVTLEEAYQLSNAYPNPVRSTATLDLTVQQAQSVTATVYDLLGRKVETLHSGDLAANTPTELRLSADRLPSGTYFVRVEGDSFTATRRLTVVR